MDWRDVTCCFTGHRPSKLPWGTRDKDERCLALKAEIAMRLEGIYQAGYRHFVCGMALGCDTFFAEAVQALKKKYQDVSLEAAVPCRTQASKWNPVQREKYYELLCSCDRVTIMQEEYTPGCMMRRNQYMADCSSLMLACFNGRPGGTMSTIVYAQRHGVKVLIIDV